MGNRETDRCQADSVLCYERRSLETHSVEQGGQVGVRDLIR
jgi:hypothetical protein